MLPGKKFGKLDSVKRHILHSLDRTQLIFTCILLSFSQSLVIHDSRAEVQRFMTRTCFVSMIHDSGFGARKTQVFWRQSEARTAATVWNWSGKTLSPGALLAVLYFSLFHIYLSACLDFPSPPLSAPGSPRMSFLLLLRRYCIVVA